MVGYIKDTKISLINSLNRYRLEYPSESAEVFKCIEFIKQHEDCLFRSCELGHITASCWIENREGNRFLLTKQKKIGIWLPLGGHIEVGESLVEESIREAREESGLTEFQLMSEEIFDFGCHVYPAYKDVPEHYHFDACFYLKALEDDDQIKISDESDDLRWFQKIPENTDKESLLKLVNKWKMAKQRKSA